MIIGFVIGIFSELLAFRMTSLLGIGIFVLLNMLATAVANGIFSGVFMMMLPNEKGGTIYSFMACSGSFGGAISTSLIGLAADYFPISIIVSICCLLTMVPVIYLLKQKKQLV